MSSGRRDLAEAARGSDGEVDTGSEVGSLVSPGEASMVLGRWGSVLENDSTTRQD